MKKTTKGLAVFMMAVTIAALSCSTSQKGIYSTRGLTSEDKKFLNTEPREEELFRIVLTSEKYLVKQMQSNDTIQRVIDTEGDRYICGEIRKIDMIEETREGIVSLILYPDSGKVMRVRPKKSTYIMEIDKIITEDMQRWTFSFPNDIVEPTKFDVHYRVKLRKRQTDEDIMREVRENMREQE